MNHPFLPDHYATLEAQEVIARQEQTIEELRSALEREQFAQELHQLLADTTMIGSLLSPVTHTRLLEMVVQTSAQVIGARSGSIFLIDREAGDLTFEVAIGPEAQAVKALRVPLGHGVVGLVAVSGQPIAVANAEQDARLAVDIASAIQHVPKSLLCVPLFYEEEIIGALELLDKIGGGSFSPVDMHMLGLFANMAAVAIAQSRAYHDQQAVLDTLLHGFAEKDAARRQQFYQRARSFSTWLQREPCSNNRVTELAALVHELATSGEYEYETCKHILQGMVGSMHARQGMSDFHIASGSFNRSTS